MLIVDAHQDIAFNTLTYGRDYRTSALKHRELEAGRGYPQATLGLPDSLLGRVGIIFATLFVAPAGTPSFGNPPHPQPRYHDSKEAYTYAMTQLDYYHRLTDEDQRVRLIQTQGDLDAVIATWDADQTTADHQQGLVVLMEGADPIIEPKQFEEWYERGVRVVGTAWQATRYSGGTGAPGGLTHLGKDLLAQMAGFNALLDISHMAEQAVYEALDRYDGQVIASHSNPRKFCDRDRHLSDDMIRKLAERDGVMGIVLYNRFLQLGWKKSDPRLPLTIVADAIDHVCQLTGSARHVGIGSDFDGGFGAESTPEGFDTSGDINAVIPLLEERGYDDADIRQIMGENMIRKLRETLPA